MRDADPEVAVAGELAGGGEASEGIAEALVADTQDAAEGGSGLRGSSTFDGGQDSGIKIGRPGGGSGWVAEIVDDVEVWGAVGAGLVGGAQEE